MWRRCGMQATVPHSVSKLVIGTRRTNPTRLFRALAIFVLVIVVSTFVVYGFFRRVVSYNTPSGDAKVPALTLLAGGEQQSLYCDTSTLRYRGALSITRLVGDAHTIGVCHGRLLGKTISGVNRSFMPSITQAISRDGWLGQATYTMRTNWRYRLVDDGMDPSRLLETAGMLKGLTATTPDALNYAQLLRQQTALDLGVPIAQPETSPQPSIARSLSYVVPIRNEGGDRLVIGHSFSLPGIADGGETIGNNIVVEFKKPSGMIPFVSIGWPGLVGVVTGINARSIAVMVHPSWTSDIRIDRKAECLTMIARKILEQAKDLKQAIKLAESAEVLGAGSIVVVDGQARKWAVVERSPTHTAVRRSPRPNIVTDILAADVFSSDPENDRARRRGPSQFRAREMHKRLRSRPPQDAKGMVDILRRDNHGASQTDGHPNNVHDDDAVHAVVIDASKLMLWVGEGPGAFGQYFGFDLRYELLADGESPDTPPDIPQARASDIRSARSLLRARRDLRAAWLARHQGHLRRASESVSRALARAPTFPAALKLAGDLAKELGQEDMASHYYKRYIATTPPDFETVQTLHSHTSKPRPE